MFSLQKCLLLDPDLCNGSVGLGLCPRLMVCQDSPLLHLILCHGSAGHCRDRSPVTVTLVALVMLKLSPAKSAYRAVVAASIPAQVQGVLGYQLRFNSSNHRTVRGGLKVHFIPPLCHGLAAVRPGCFKPCIAWP